MEEKFDNATREELIPIDVSIYGFIARYRIAHDNDPDTPPDKDKPSGPYIPLALRK